MALARWPEGGTLPAAAVIAAAIDDALSPFGVRFRDVPILPHQIVAEIAEAGKLV